MSVPHTPTRLTRTSTSFSAMDGIDRVVACNSPGRLQTTTVMEVIKRYLTW
jgi:hypothetical protein